VLRICFALAALGLGVLQGCASGSAVNESLHRAASEANAGSIRRSYVDARFGQIHIYKVEPVIAHASRRHPMLYFHPTAVSGDYFHDMLLEMGEDRVVMAMDTPGYGQSDRPPEPQSIGELASAAADALDALGYGRDGLGAIDVVGYHTGTLIAAELAITRPDLVRRLVLPGIPYYVGEERLENYERLTSPKVMQEDGSHVMDIWTFWVTNRNDGVSLERGAEHFADELQSGDASWWAYHGVFSYAPEDRFPLVTQRVLIPNPHGGLMEQSEAAAELFPNAKLIDMPNLHHGIFDIGVAELAAVFRDFLDH